MGKTKNRAAQAAAAGQTRAAPGSPEAARAAAHLTPLLRRNEQATVLAAALTALGQLFANGTLNETDFAALEAREPPHSPLARQIRACLHTLANGRQTPP